MPTSLNYPITEPFTRFRDWKPQPPLSFGWTMKPVSSAPKAEIKVLPNKQFELTISHDIVKGVTRRCCIGGSAASTAR